jgi:flotillin
VAAAVRRVAQLEMTSIEIVDGGDAESLAAVMAGFSRGVSRVLEETGNAIGVDVRALIGGSK